jgi:alcohol dehydrogenase, propanol-preferring
LDSQRRLTASSQDLPVGKMSTFGVSSPGHEGVGRVVALGPNVPETLGLKVGDRAGIKPLWTSCNSCMMCTSDREMYCTAGKQTGLHVAGSYQQYVLGDASHVMKIPDGVPDDIAAPIMCSGATIYRAIKEAGFQPGDWVAFVGAGGGVGHMGVMYAKAMGIRAIGIDGGAEKGEMCKRIGAEHFVDFTQVSDVNAEVVRLTDGLGAHGVIVTATGSAPYKSAIGMLRTSGTMMCIGLRAYPFLKRPSILTVAAAITDVPQIADPLTLIGKNIKVTGTIIGSRNDCRMALQFAAQV